ncbi:unnamed protein product [Amoebophrya sp. A120]|nr:unnamed protein product [Amoebophrya sp. A120]|eukprot:GSA120T00022256001.1
MSAIAQEPPSFSSTIVDDLDALLLSWFDKDATALLFGRAYQEWFQWQEFVALYFVTFCVLYHYVRQYDKNLVLRALQQEFNDVDGAAETRAAAAAPKTTPANKGSTAHKSIREQHARLLTLSRRIAIWKQLTYMLVGLAIGVAAVYLCAKAATAQLTGYFGFLTSSSSSANHGLAEKTSTEPQMIMEELDDEVLELEQRKIRAVIGGRILVGLAGTAVAFFLDYAAQQILRAAVQQEQERKLKAAAGNMSMKVE